MKDRGTHHKGEMVASAVKRVVGGALIAEGAFVDGGVNSRIGSGQIIDVAQDILRIIPSATTRDEIVGSTLVVLGGTLATFGHKLFRRKST